MIRIKIKFRPRFSIRNRVSCRFQVEPSSRLNFEESPERVSTDHRKWSQKSKLRTRCSNKCPLRPQQTLFIYRRANHVPRKKKPSKFRKYRRSKNHRSRPPADEIAKHFQKRSPKKPLALVALPKGTKLAPPISPHQMASWLS